MRTAEPNPFGDTSGVDMIFAISPAGRANVPGGGNVETVVTVCTHRRCFGIVLGIKDQRTH
jgi:hypothetical protein